LFPSLATGIGLNTRCKRTKSFVFRFRVWNKDHQVCYLAPCCSACGSTGLDVTTFRRSPKNLLQHDETDTLHVRAMTRTMEQLNAQCLLLSISCYRLVKIALHRRLVTSGTCEDSPARYGNAGEAGAPPGRSRTTTFSLSCLASDGYTSALSFVASSLD
jgi:hypothetical protein